MDIIGGLTAAKLALDLVKDLREIDKSIDEATFKLKLAELTSALADTKVALSDAKLSLQEKDEAIASLKTSIDVARNGEVCPKCRSGRLSLSKTTPHHQFGAHHFGVEKWTFCCSDAICGFEQVRVHDPNGAMKEFARKS